MSAENKAVVQSFLEGFMTDDRAKVESLVTADYVDHNPLPGTQGGI